MGLKKFEFYVLRSEYHYVTNILKIYADRYGVLVDDMSPRLIGDTWTFHCRVRCTDEVYEKLRKRLDEDWLIYEP